MSVPEITVRVEIPKDGWLHDWAMRKVFGEHLDAMQGIMKYPLKAGGAFGARNEQFPI